MKFIVNLYHTALATIGVVAVMAIIVFLLICLIAVLFAKCKLFSKCGYEWWKGLIPLYSEYIFFTKICELHWAWYVAWLAVTLMSFEETTVTFLKLFVNAMAFYNLAIKCNKDNIASMIFGGFFPGFVEIYYAYSDTYYNKDIPVKQSGLF